MKKKINLNELARRIAIREGKKTAVNIAQIKEILRITFDELCWFTSEKVIALIYERGWSKRPAKAKKKR